MPFNETTQEKEFQVEVNEFIFDTQAEISIGKSKCAWLIL